MKVLVFGGSSEGRRLAEELFAAGVDATLSVATDYGGSIAENSGVKLLTKRMDESAIRDFLKLNRFDYVVDATHPYAEDATKNIKSACAAENARYLRLSREKSSRSASVSYVPTFQAAADMLENRTGNIFIALGSKELEAFAIYKDRAFLRILPMPESLEKAASLGFKNRNIICMHGPFSTEINVAMLKSANAKYLVTKDSGAAGGFAEKLEAASLTGCETIVVERPEDESGYAYDELLKLLMPDSCRKNSVTSSFFPLFVDLRRRAVTVVGGGKIAERRVKTLERFGAAITVISPEITEPILLMSEQGRIVHIKRRYRNNDVSGSFFAVAATNDKNVNREIAADAKSLNIPVSVADSREECDCFFPAIAQNERYTAGIVSNDGNHGAVREMAIKVRKLINDEQED